MSVKEKIFKNILNLTVETEIRPLHQAIVRMHSVLKNHDFSPTLDP